EQALGIHFGDGGALELSTVLLFEDHGNLAHQERDVADVLEAEVEHHHRTLIVQRGGAHFEDIAHQAGADSALLKQHDSEHQGDDRGAHPKAYQKIFGHQSSPTMRMISSMEVCAAAISVPSKIWVSSPILPL